MTSFLEAAASAYLFIIIISVVTCLSCETLVDAVEPVSRGELCSSPLLNQQLTKFSHEVVDLLQHSPQCCLPFSRFIPTYHHHFGRQCRIANYGFTKLIELFDAVPHVVEVCVCEDTSDVGANITDVIRARHIVISYMLVWCVKATR